MLLANSSSPSSPAAPSLLYGAVIPQQKTRHAHGAALVLVKNALLDTCTKHGMSVNKTHELSHNLLLQTHSPHFSPSPSISAPFSMFRSIETRTCVLPCPTALTNAACSQMSRQRTQLHTTALGDASGLSASASLARSMRRLVTTSGVPCASASASVAVLTSLPSFFALSCPGVAACCVAHLFISVREHAPRLRLAIHGVQRTWHIAGLRAGQQYVQQASLLYV